jgi:hypothetical protein
MVPASKGLRYCARPYQRADFHGGQRPIDRFIVAGVRHNLVDRFIVAEAGLNQVVRKNISATFIQ